MQTYTNGSNYPSGGTSLTVGAVAFTLAKYPGGGTGVIQTPNRSSPSSFDVPVNIANPTEVYTLINSGYGEYGDTVGAVEFEATGGLDYTVKLVEGQDIRDHNNGGFNNTIGNGALGGIYVGTASFGGGKVRLDEQGFMLPSSFQSSTLTDIILHGYGDDPTGTPFLAAATVTNSPTTPTPPPTPTPIPPPPVTLPISPTPTPIPPTPTPNPPTPTPTPPGFTPPPAPPPRPAPGPTTNPMPPGSGAFRTQTSVIADPRSAAFGQPITLTATVKNVSAVIGVPDGNVTFLDGTNVLGIANLRGGKASITIGNLPVGQDAIKVVYGGSDFAPSTSGVLIESVHANQTSTQTTRHIKGVVGDTTGSVARGSLLRRHAVRQSMVNTMKPLIPAVKA
jgi:hypothetical protein